MKKKEIEVIDRGGAKTVAKKTSLITRTKRIFAIVSVLWLVFITWFPLYVKNTYAGTIKKSMVVSMFFDLQRNIQKSAAFGIDCKIFRLTVVAVFLFLGAIVKISAAASVAFRIILNRSAFGIAFIFDLLLFMFGFFISNSEGGN